MFRILSVHLNVTAKKLAFSLSTTTTKFHSARVVQEHTFIRYISNMADYTVSDCELTTSDNIKLLGKQYLPNNPPKATITLVHGFGEHIGRYSHVCDFFCKNGFLINLFDQRGHGKSGGTRAHTPSITQSLDDIQLVANKASPDLPHFLYGHSMGGGFSLLFAERMKPVVPFSGIVITDPLIKLFFTPPRAKVFIGRLVAKIMPETSMGNEIRPNDLSRDPEVGKAYEADPLVLRCITTGMGNILLSMGDSIIDEANKIQDPILLVHGTGDTITSCQATQQVHELISSKDKTLQLMEGWYHEPHNETEKQVLFDLVLSWLHNHLPSSADGKSSQS